MRYIVDDEQFTITPLADGSAGEATSWFDDAGFAWLSRLWTQASWQRRYTYQFHWLGRPIIQLPADVMLMQELIWRTKPTVIIETGIARGGSVILHASLLRLIHEPRPDSQRPLVIAIDIDIRPHNRAELENHALRSTYTLIEGSSIASDTIARVRRLLRPDDRVMVALDSNHAKEHVAEELQAYATLVSPGCPLVVMDGVMPQLAHLPDGQRGWLDDHPGLAIDAFLSTQVGRDFAVSREFDGFAVTHSPGGVLLRNAGDPA